MTTTIALPREEVTSRRRGAFAVGKTGRRPLLYVFLTVMALAWIFPVFWAMLNSFRNYSYTSTHGYVSLGGFTMQNYVHAWQAGDFTQHFLNSVIITVPAVVVTLFFASCVAFVIARFSLLVQPAAADRLHRRQPAAAAGAARAAVPAVHLRPGAVLVQRLGRALRQLLGGDHHSYRLPDRLLHLRPEQLHEDAAQGAYRGRRRRRRQRAAAVLPDHPAAVPPAARRARDARDHLDLQRLLLGSRVHEHRRQVSRSRRRCRTCVGSSSPTTTCCPPVRCWRRFRR